MCGTKLCQNCAETVPKLCQNCASQVRLLELRLRAEEQSRQLTDFISSKGRLHNENSELARQVTHLHNIVILIFMQINL